MADIATAQSFADTLDPQEVLDFVFEFHDLLEPGEELNPAEWTIEIPLEGAGLGLVIMEGDGRDPVLTDGNKAIKFWLSIAEEDQDSPDFDGGGISIPILATGETNSTPYRKRQRTAKVRVAHQ
jgi:hypothetical protein